MRQSTSYDKVGKKNKITLQSENIIGLVVGLGSWCLPLISAQK